MEFREWQVCNILTLSTNYNKYIYQYIDHVLMSPYNYYKGRATKYAGMLNTFLLELTFTEDEQFITSLDSHTNL